MCNNRIFSRLEALAISNCNHRWAKVSAAIVLKNGVIAYGINKKKSHPFQAKYCKNVESIFLHAENCAIHNALRLLDVDDLQYCELYICRMKKINGIYVYGMAKPCDGCMKAILEFDIKKVYFTTDEGEIQKL
jgi:deoxycytidylate deaminase